MGILNVTTDSFYDGNRHFDIDNALMRAYQMIEHGADIIDVGGESSRPGSLPMDEETETARVLPIVSELKKNSDILISVDTYKPAVAKAVIEAGADIINDIYALSFGDMVKILGEHEGTQVILMHMQGTPADMQLAPKYRKDIVTEITDFFYDKIALCTKNGIKEECIILDPGIGFGKTAQHNITILQNMKSFDKFGLPIMIGASRKSFINEIYKSTPEQRLMGSLATTVKACLSGVDIIRVHDVLEHKQMIESLAIMFS
jgi:dihydropteroate synthase